MSRVKLWIKIFRSIVIAVVIIAWIFSGWPQIWQNPRIPPRIQVTRAAIAITVTPGTVAYGTIGHNAFLSTCSGAGDLKNL